MSRAKTNRFYPLSSASPRDKYRHDSSIVLQSPDGGAVEVVIEELETSPIRFIYRCVIILCVVATRSLGTCLRCVVSDLFLFRVLSFPESVPGRE